MEQQNKEWGREFSRRVPRIRRADDYGYGVYNPFEVTAQRSHAMHFNIYLYGPIMDVEQFIGPIEVLKAAAGGDLVEVHLSTPGGLLDATDTFLQAMHECEGRVVVRASGGVHSAGTIILLHANEFTLSPNFNALIHNGSTGAGGDFNKFAASAKHSIDYMNKVMRSTYEGFLTPDELEAMIEGKDFWLDAPEWMRRWNNRQAYFKAKMERQQMLPMDFGHAEGMDEEPEIEVTPRPPRRRKKAE